MFTVMTYSIVEIGTGVAQQCADLLGKIAFGKKQLKKEGVSTSFIWSIFISCLDRLQNYTLDMELQKVREMIHDVSLHSYCEFTLSRSLVWTGC